MKHNGAISAFFEVLRCLHFVDVTRVHRMMQRVVYFWIFEPFRTASGPASVSEIRGRVDGVLETAPPRRVFMRLRRRDTVVMTT